MAALRSQDLAPWLGREDLTLEELIAAADSLLERVAPTQRRYKVKERPDVRTVRYYTSEGLLPKPLSYAGGRARYGGVHLVRLLLIKALQAEQQTLGRIKEVLGGLRDDDVMGALLERASSRRAPRRLTLAPSAVLETRLEAPRITPSLHVELIHGGRLDVPQEVLDDDGKLRELAGDLEALARWLREEKKARNDDNGGSR